MGDRFLIMTRRDEVRARNLERLLAPYGQTEIIVDEETTAKGCVWVSNEAAKGCEGLTSASGSFPKIGAWARAMRHVELTFDDRNVWFVEEDVAGDAASWGRLVKSTAEYGADLSAIWLVIRSQDKRRWRWWNYAEPYFLNPARSFNPLCRLSPELLRLCFWFRQLHGRYTFMETMFHSLAVGKRTLDWKASPLTRDMFQHFDYRPFVTTVQEGISHPLKDAALHTEICNL